jgi:hypothetical protein
MNEIENSTLAEVSGGYPDQPSAFPLLLPDPEPPMTICPPEPPPGKPWFFY